MTNRIWVTEGEWTTLRTHLLQNDEEQAAIGYAKTVTNSGGVEFQIQELEYLEPEDFAFQSSYHISLADHAQARIIKAAWDRRSAIVEFHSHTDPLHSARFSPSDLAGFEEFVPHVWWRLQGVPYAAVVIAANDFDAIAWRLTPTDAEPVSSIELGSHILSPTGRTLSRVRGEDGY